MNKFLLTALLLSGPYFLAFADDEYPTYIPSEEEEKQATEQVAGIENRYEYNMYDRQENRRDQQQRQQYYYNQSQDQNNSAPQYNRSSSPRSQYFNPRDE